MIVAFTGTMLALLTHTALSVGAARFAVRRFAAKMRAEDPALRPVEPENAAKEFACDACHSVTCVRCGAIL